MIKNISVKKIDANKLLFNINSIDYELDFYYDVLNRVRLHYGDNLLKISKEHGIGEALLEAHAKRMLKKKTDNQIKEAIDTLEGAYYLLTSIKANFKSENISFAEELIKKEIFKKDNELMDFIFSEERE